MSVPPKPGLGLPLVGIAPPDAPDAPPFAPDAPPGPPGAPPDAPAGPGAPGAPGGSKAKEKVDSILISGLGHEAIIQALEKEIDEAIRESIVGPDDSKSAQDVPSILKGIEDLYESRISSEYVLLASDILQFKQTDKTGEKTFKQTIESSLDKDIAELKEELRKINTDIQSSSTCQDFIKVQEGKLKELREKYTSVMANVLAPGKKSDSKTIAAAQIVVKKYHDKEVELRSLQALKAGDPLPISLFVLVSSKSSRLARLEKRLELLGSGQEIKPDSEAIIKSHKDMKWQLQKELRIYYLAWAKEKIALMQDSGMNVGKAVTALSKQQTEYQEGLKERYPDRGKEFAQTTSNIDSSYATTAGKCQEILAQQAFNQEAELSAEDALTVLAPLVSDVGKFLEDITEAVDKAIETKVSIEEGEIRMSAAVEQARAISTVVRNLKLDAKDAAEVVSGQADAEQGEAEVKQEKEVITQTSKESLPIIFDFRLNCYYTAPELAKLAKHFGLSFNCNEMYAGLKSRFEVFKTPSELDGKKLRDLEMLFPRKQCGLRLIDAEKHVGDIIVPDNEIILAKEKNKFVVFYRKKNNAESFKFECDSELTKLVEPLDFNGGILDCQKHAKPYDHIKRAVQKNKGYTSLQISRGMLDSQGVFQPCECIQSVLGITDINAVFKARVAERKKQAAAAALKQGNAEPKNDDASSEEDEVVFHTIPSDADTDTDSEVTKAVGNMMVSAVALEAKLAQERQAREAAEQALKEERKARAEAESQREEEVRKNTEIKDKIKKEGAEAVLSSHEIRTQQVEKQKTGRLARRG